MVTIGFLIDYRTVISKNLLAIIRKFIHKDLAIKFTCVKQTKEKFTLKPSAFYNCIIGKFIVYINIKNIYFSVLLILILFIILEVFMKKSINGAIQETVSEKILERLIESILTNSKDWEKGRSHTKDVDDITEETEEQIMKKI